MTKTITLPTAMIPSKRNAAVDDYDLVVVGGGSAAFAAAIKASELGGRVAVVNEGLPFGGTCANVGCVPSKTIIRAAEAVHRARRTPFDGIQVSGDVTDFAAVTAQTQALVGELRREKYLEVVADDPNVDLVRGRAHLASAQAVEVGGRQFGAKYILIATGARTFVPEIPGLAGVGYVTNEELYRLETAPEHLILLGGRYIALENAQAFSRLGSKVTVLQRSARILPSEAADLTDALTAYLIDEGVAIHTGVDVTAVRREGEDDLPAARRSGADVAVAHSAGVEVPVLPREGGDVIVEARIDGETTVFRGSHLLLATGRQANTEDLGLEALGIRTKPHGFLDVDETLRTTVPTIFGAGDVLGENMFVYTAAYEGSLAAQNAVQGLHLKRDYTVLPWVVFTDPQVAGVGMDARQAAEAGLDADVATLPLAAVPRSLAARDTRGFITLVRDRATDRIVGARILAPEGAELLMEVALAIKFGATARDLAGMFHPYLTLSEGIKLAAIAFEKDVKKLSCCAS